VADIDTIDLAGGPLVVADMFSMFISGLII
jgi:hypothetical protein